MLNSSLSFSLSVSPLFLSASVSLVGYGNRAQKLLVRSGPHIGGPGPAGRERRDGPGVGGFRWGRNCRVGEQLVKKPSQVPSTASGESKPRKP